ncbi:hypothetical protein AGMMS49574_26970 [Bacteroidia bacterium]|nr:hypothetical protein AGMMS49574_26970 [Bacteroidia bacterium]
MNTIRNTAYWLERFNSLVKLQLKIKAESYTDEVKINFAGEPPNIDAFKACVGQTIESGKHLDSFIDTINLLFFLSEANSDLMVEGNLSSHQAYNEFCKLSPHIRELDKLSLDVFEFVDEISHYYTGFENRQTELPECRYKEDRYILWSLYHLVSSFVVSYHEQEMIDFQNHLSYLNKSEVNNFIRQQQDECLEKIWESVKGFCDRNIVFNYLEPDSDTETDYLIYTVVSGFMEKAGVDDYIRYVEFDYTKYKPSFRWDFGKNTIEDYKDLSALPRFNRLVFLLCHIICKGN